ncbi:hypothetical protein [Kitasatospora sp. GP82]|uniref:hypothetical protein n=1 Tax=Kitasatospora sp. GP82 TaxID=3035089 RepID=UPI0024751180|nr:hypothetical protein [Kitasatospora sp. GP82]MDH6125461.1 hypothetical protein [Kitasatospora sp. GP82]
MNPSVGGALSVTVRSTPEATAVGAVGAADHDSVDPLHPAAPAPQLVRLMQITDLYDLFPIDAQPPAADRSPDAAVPAANP